VDFVYAIPLRKQFWYFLRSATIFFHSTENIFIETRTPDTFSWIVTFVPVISTPNKCSIGAVILSYLVSELQIPFSLWLEPRRDLSLGYVICFHNPLADINKFVLGAILLSSLLPWYRNHSHLDSKVLKGCGICSCYLPVASNNFGFGAIVLSCLVT